MRRLSTRSCCRSRIRFTVSAVRVAGLPVVDRPIAVTAAQARELGEIGPAVFPFHNRRWDGDFRTVQRLIAERSAGCNGSSGGGRR